MIKRKKENKRMTEMCSMTQAAIRIIRNFMDEEGCYISDYEWRSFRGASLVCDWGDFSDALRKIENYCEEHLGEDPAKKSVRSCSSCFYEATDGRAYPCSMCIRGEERRDQFYPKLGVDCSWMRYEE